MIMPFQSFELGPSVYVAAVEAEEPFEWPGEATNCQRHRECGPGDSRAVKARLSGPRVLLGS